MTLPTSPTDITVLLETAITAARKAGAVLLDHYRRAPEGVCVKSSPTDPVSAADLAAENAVRTVLKEARPTDGVLGEEGGETLGSSGLRWVVDPLDGTTNYLYRIPVWNVSIACEDGRGGVVGVVFDPLRDELFTATREGEAQLNGVPIQPSGRVELATALVATGYGYKEDMRRRQGAIAAQLLPHIRDLRRVGSAALDLAWTACGRYDAYYEHGIQLWDTAAGEVICRAAGLAVHHLSPSTELPSGILVARAELADQVAPLLRLSPAFGER